MINTSEDISAKKAGEVVRLFENFKRVKDADDENRRQSSVTKYDLNWVE